MEVHMVGSQYSSVVKTPYSVAVALFREAQTLDAEMKKVPRGVGHGDVIRDFDRAILELRREAVVRLHKAHSE